ncbi:thioesterase family protein [Kineosporia sp. NBRC 101731]|uniref:acyl-CoA thioesterase n=1 Tax=Kineosporia sp. NBRC 101731 TaxID=3032199 RepID=UPI0024A3B15C|nr:thioesterase family protein [Kineosporia sp. NBRC 101731]GLY32233.1 thioesterase [Kineosporia sp. NBRC 101731]
MNDYGHHGLFPTRWNDNDQYAHVNNAVYYEAMDTTINTWLIAAGLVPGGGTEIAICVSSACEYRAPISFPDVMRVGLRAGRLGTSSVTWELAIHRQQAGKEDTEPAATGRFVHVFVDAKNRRPVPIPAHLRAAIERDLLAR